MPDEHARPEYRPDIDGLRAVAVLSVIGFHAAPGRFHGGFIGVDVFFVISGFLISGIIFRGLDSGAFSFADFYSRRIRRIFPSLLVLLLAAFAVGWVALLAEEFKQLDKHIAAGAGFVSNLALWSESGYFDVSAEMKPLLHLWSLAIEEQFYIAWPLLLSVFWKKRGGFVAVTGAVLAASFGANLFAASRYPSAAFYSPITRFWELMLGGMLAYASLQFPRPGRRTAHVCSVAGAVLLLAGLLLIDRTRTFPGWWALLPAAGAFLIIQAGPDAIVNSQLLSSKLMVGIGLISYPLYLWHWPLLSFLRVFNGHEVPQAVRAYAVLVSFPLAWLTYALIEKPLRHEKRGAAKVAGLLVTMLVVGCAGYGGYRLEGFSTRQSLPRAVNDGQLGAYSYFEFLSRTYGPCTPDELLRTSEPWNGFPTCFQSRRSSAVDFAIVGDSHADHVFPGLAEGLPEANVAIYEKDGLPLRSNRDFDMIFTHLTADHSIKTVVMAARWSSRIKDGSESRVEADLAATIDSLIAAGKEVYLLDDVPGFPFEPSECKYAGRLWLSHRCTQPRLNFLKQAKAFWPIQDSLRRRNRKLKIVRIGDYFCDNEVCSMAKDGTLFYRDSNHLNLSGSRYLGQRLVQSFPAIANKVRSRRP